MEKPKNIEELIFAWPKPGSVNLAADLNMPDHPVKRQRVDRWCRVGSIPAKYFGSIIRAAQSRGIVLTADDLVRIHDKEA